MASRRLVLAGLCSAVAAPALGEDLGFAVGQIWTLKPPMNADARIRIGRIEDDGATLHISLWTGAMPPQHEGMASFPLIAGHLPIARDALQASVDRRVDDEAPPTSLGFEEGYAAWRQNNGGVFTISVYEIVEMMVQAAQRDQALPK
jgi:hypothetical protein